MANYDTSVKITDFNIDWMKIKSGCMTTISKDAGTTEPSQEFLESSSSEKIKSSSSVETSSNSLSIYEAVKENEFYTTKDSVAAYLCRFGNLPKNYVNKATAQTLYEETTGNAFSKWNFNPWKLLSIMVGGDTFSNREGLLPEASYKEADVEYFAENRGTKRLVYAENCVIYYTADHYESFSLLEIEK